MASMKTLNCAVCGDRAKCSYFGAISCESCKVFFRRAVNDGIHLKYQCSDQGMCEINVRTRKLCQRCRFQKCLSRGMKTQWVKVSSPTSRERWKRSVSNFLPTSPRRAPGDLTGRAPGDHPPRRAPGDLTGRAPSDHPPRRAPGDLTGRAPSDNPPRRAPGDLLSGIPPGNGENHENCGFVHILDQEDLQCIQNAVDNTSRTIKEIPFPDRAYVERPTFSHIVNVFAIVVRRITAFAKTFTEFRELKISDQLALLKGATLEVMMTRKATTILYKKTQRGFVWMVEDDKYLLSQEDLQHAYDRNLYESHMDYIRSLMNLKVNDTTLVLLTCVILFSPDREELRDVAKVEEVQTAYVKLLEKYVHCTFGCDRGKKLFPKLLVLMCKAREASHYYSKSVLETRPEEIEPIMKEFFGVS